MASLAMVVIGVNDSAICNGGGTSYEDSGGNHYSDCRQQRQQ